MALFGAYLPFWDLCSKPCRFCHDRGPELVMIERSGRRQTLVGASRGLFRLSRAGPVESFSSASASGSTSVTSPSSVVSVAGPSSRCRLTFLHPSMQCSSSEISRLSAVGVTVCGPREDVFAVEPACLRVCMADDALPPCIERRELRCEMDSPRRRLVKWGGSQLENVLGPPGGTGVEEDDG
ncbi:hypothetical protein PENSPDRAFT_131149 [Peniophora sp. CONT]|nr:hypothetical protein PENSPDRAFT_131149 [Peniophora sp. CONT]